MSVTVFRPSFGGDFRLTADPKDPTRSILTVHDPTPAELSLLARFIADCRSKDFCRSVEGIALSGKSELPLSASTAVVGAMLLSAGRSEARPTLTVIESKVEKKGQASILRTTFDGPPSASELDQEGNIVAVTVEKPKPGRGAGDCPEALASEVLFAFQSPEQRTQYEETTGFYVYGGISGRRYRLAHRKHHLARQQGGVAVGMDEGRRRPVPVLAFDWMVPPPEELLAFMLVLEHREHWLRNRRVMPGARGRVFPDPHAHLTASDRSDVRMIDSFEGGLRLGTSLVGATLQRVMHRR